MGRSLFKIKNSRQNPCLSLYEKFFMFKEVCPGKTPTFYLWQFCGNLWHSFNNLYFIEGFNHHFTVIYLYFSIKQR